MVPQPVPGQIWEFRSARSRWKVLGVYEESNTCAIELVEPAGASQDVGWVNGSYSLSSLTNGWVLVKTLRCAECDEPAQDDYLCKECRGNS